MDVLSFVLGKKSGGSSPTPPTPVSPLPDITGLDYYTENYIALGELDTVYGYKYTILFFDDDSSYATIQDGEWGYDNEKEIYGIMQIYGGLPNSGKKVKPIYNMAQDSDTYVLYRTDQTYYQRTNTSYVFETSIDIINRNDTTQILYEAGYYDYD